MFSFDIAVSGFNPRVLAGGRDRAQAALCRAQNVSIHASSREDATCLVQVFFHSRHGFQSTRPRGRTRHGLSPWKCRNRCFNPRVLAGGRDGKGRALKTAQGCFNPRVLAGGRDVKFLDLESLSQSFNPRVLAGGRDKTSSSTAVP